MTVLGTVRADGDRARSSRENSTPLVHPHGCLSLWKRLLQSITDQFIKCKKREIIFQKSLAFLKNICYNTNVAHGGVVQLVERRSPKPHV